MAQLLLGTFLHFYVHATVDSPALFAPASALDRAESCMSIFQRLTIHSVSLHAWPMLLARWLLD